MGKETGIAWADATWNPAQGCTKVSPGCDNCYAEALSRRYGWKTQFATVQLMPHRLDVPFNWKKPKRIFVGSITDMFHPQIPDIYLCAVWLTMLEAKQHTYMLLTKRPHRMRHKVDKLGLELPRHIWLGTSVEQQRFYDNRVPALMGIPASVRFLSVEPLLEHVTIQPEALPVEWVIVGGESGPRARPMDEDWARSLRDQCAGAGIPYFYKQRGARVGHGSDLLDGVAHKEFPVVR